MSDTILKICQVRGVPPTRAHDLDAGMDLRWHPEQGQPAHMWLMRGNRYTLTTGTKISLEPGYEAQVRPRSGLAHKHGLLLLNAPGTIDCGYHGEIHVIMYNTGRSIELRAGDRIAQLVVQRVPTVHVDLCGVEDLGTSERGEKGLGSSGVK